MEFTISGLICDYCDYRDDDVKYEDYKSSIGRPCPNCWHSLLTQEEYQKVVTMYKVVAKLNAAGNVLKWLNPFHYYRLVFGDKRQMACLRIKYPTKTKA